MRPSHLVWRALAPILLFSPPAMAGDVAAAASLFNKGVAEMEAEHFEVACPALDESQRLDPQAGTVFTRAECHARWGKLATAVALYGDYLRLFDGMPDAQRKRHEERARFATERGKSLAAEVPELTMVMPKDAPAAVKVTRDGVELEAPSIGVALPLDPGEHVIVVEAVGRTVSTQTVVLAKGDKKTVDLIVGAEVVIAPPPVPAESTAPAIGEAKVADRPAAEAPRGGEASAWSSGRKAAVVVAGGLGFSGLIVGSITGGLAISARSVVLQHCGDTKCDHEGKVAADSAKGLSNGSTAAFGIGIAGVAVATVLWVTVPSSKRAQVGVIQVGATGAMLGMRGSF